MSNLHPVFREIADSFFLTPPPDSGSRVGPHAACKTEYRKSRSDTK